MTRKQLSPISWQAEHGDFDFHIRLEQDNYVIDVFDSMTGNPDVAYLTTYTFRLRKTTARQGRSVRRYYREHNDLETDSR